MQSKPVSALAPLMVIVAGLAVGSLSPLYTRDAFVHLALLTIVLPLSVLIVLGSLPLLRSRAAGRKQGPRGMLLVGLFGLTQWAGIPVFNHLHAEQERTARGYCLDILSVLERHRDLHGAYPTDIDSVATRETAPWFLRTQRFYRAWQTPDGTSGFSFQFRLPGNAPLVMHRYDSTSGEWIVDD